MDGSDRSSVPGAIRGTLRIAGSAAIFWIAALVIDWMIMEVGSLHTPEPGRSRSIALGMVWAVLFTFGLTIGFVITLCIIALVRHRRGRDDPFGSPRWFPLLAAATTALLAFAPPVPDALIAVNARILGRHDIWEITTIPLIVAAAGTGMAVGLIAVVTRIRLSG